MSEFLAEAQVLIVPNTAAFRAELVAQLNALKIPPVSVPILAAGTGLAGAAAATTALAASQEAARGHALGLASAAEVEASSFGKLAVVLGAVTEETVASAAAAQKLGLSNVRAAASTSTLERAQFAGAASARALSVAQLSVAGATTGIASAQAAVRASADATTVAQRALTISLRAGNIALIDAASQSLRLAKAQQLEAASALQAARAQTAHASSMGFVRRGAGATGLSLLGVRGATLAANSAFLAGAAGVAVFAKSVGLAANLEKQLNVFKVTAGATADEMNRVSDAARRLGTDISLPGVSAGDAASAMAELAKAGLDVEDAIGGARGTLQLATAAEIETAQATEIVANALNAFGLAGTEAVRVADLLAGASIEAQGSISDMGGALTQAAGVSKQVGISLEDTVALLTLLARAGINGAAGGTVLRVALLRLVNPVGAAKQTLSDLGLAIRDAQGAIRPEIFAELQKATEKLTKAQQDQVLAEIFGVRGLRAQAVLGRAGVDRLNEAREATQKAGLASDIAGAQTEGFTGKLENLKNQAEGLGVSIGNLVIGPLGLLVDSLAFNAQGLAFVAVQTENFAGSVRDFIRPGIENAKAVAEMTGRTGEYLDRVTEGIPILDGFFETLDKGSGAVDRQTDAFKDLAGVVSGAIGGLVGALNELNAAAATGGGVNLKPLEGKLAGLEEQITLADISGEVQTRIAARRRRLAEIEKQLNDPDVQRRPQLRRKLEEEQLSTIRELEAIQKEIASEANQLAGNIERAQRETESAFVRLLESQRGSAERLLRRAEGTEPLKDDIKFGEALAARFRAQIAQAQKTLGKTEAGRALIEDLQDQLFDVLSELDQDTRNFQKDLKEREKQRQEELKQAQQERLDRISTSIELDIELAEINENTKAEIRARQNLITNLQKEIALIKKDRTLGKEKANLLKEKRNDLARERAEIKRLKDEAKKIKDEGKNLLAEMQFDFLQKQEGFAANLLGNLIPGSATAGLVGGSQAALPTPASGLQAQAAFKTASPTYGQAATEVDILKQVLQVLREIQRGRAHPEAALQRAQVNATMDFQGGV